MATVADLLQMKEGEVHTVHPQATVLEAVRLMNRLRIGALVVMLDGQIAGMFTERDVLKVVGAGRSAETVRVEDVMTADVVCADRDMEVDKVAEIMKECRIRHLPVVNNMKHVIGLVSIGDINAMHVRQAEATIASLNDYIFGRV